MRNSLKTNHLAAILLCCLAAFSFCKHNDGGVKTVKNDDPNSLVNIPLGPDGKPDSTKAAKMVFEQPEFLFDTVKEGEVITHAFKFKNTGPVPLIIADAKSSCGCTIPEWPTTAVEPGATGEITAKFNTAHKSGNQSKLIRIYANVIPSPAEVKIKGFVIGKQPDGEGH